MHLFRLMVYLRGVVCARGVCGLASGQLPSSWPTTCAQWPQSPRDLAPRPTTWCSGRFSNAAHLQGARNKTCLCIIWLSGYLLKRWPGGHQQSKFNLIGAGRQRRWFIQFGFQSFGVSAGIQDQFLDLTGLSHLMMKITPVAVGSLLHQH